MKIRLQHAGFSLVETSVIILFVSLAMIPVVSMMGGVNDPSGSSVAGGTNVTAIAGFRSKSMTAANSIMERAQAGDTSVSFDIATIFPTVGNGSYTAPLRTFMPDKTEAYQQPIYYDWVVRDMRAKVTTSGALVPNPNGGGAQTLTPDGNQVVAATLRIFQKPDDRDNGVPPIISLPTYFSRQNCDSSLGNLCSYDEAEKTGLMIVADISMSMWWGAQSCSNNYFENPGTGLCGTIYYKRSNGQIAGFSGETFGPFLKQRYAIKGNNPPGNIRIADPFDDHNLDLTWALPLNPNSEKAETPYSDLYPLPGGGTGVNNLVTFPSGCNDLTGSTANWNAVKPFTDDEFYAGNSDRETHVKKMLQNYCGKSNWRTAAKFDDFNNRHVSRLEALRNSMLSLLVSLEENQALVRKMKVGLVPFAAGFWAGDAQGNPGNLLEDSAPPSTTAPVASSVTDYKFIKTRLNFLIMNRQKNNNGGQTMLAKDVPNGQTQTAGALQMAGKILYGDTPYPPPGVGSRMILLVTDGEPTGGHGAPQIFNISKQLGAGCNLNMQSTALTGCDPRRKTDIFVVGVIGITPQKQLMMKQVAENTENGEFYFANDIAAMQPIFQQIAYQIERTVMVSRLERLNLPVK